MNIELIVVLQAREGLTQKLHAALLELREASLGENGCLGYRLAQGQEDAGRFFLIEHWANQEALSLHQQMPHYLHGVELIQAYSQSVDMQQITWCAE